MTRLYSIVISVFLSVTLCFSQSSVWEISKGGKSVYLGGSVHILRADDYPLPETFEKIFEEADVLVLEADVKQMSINPDPELLKEMLSKMLLPEGSTLQTVLSKEMYEQLEAKASKFDLPLQEVKNFKPSAVVNMLTMLKIHQLGFTAQGVDAYFYLKAEDAGKKLEFLESVQLQLDLLTNMGVNYENEFMKYSLEDIDNTTDEIFALITDWKNGTGKSAEESLYEMKKDFPNVYDDLFLKRNNDWIPKIENYVQDDRKVFILVGLAHMYADDGLLAQLKKKGYAIKQLK